MHFSALIPVVFCCAAFILSVLCLFAGTKKSFMQDYSLLTFNASQIGENVFNTSESSDNSIANFFDEISNEIESKIEDGLTSIAQDLGLHDFYNLHIMSYCEGYYTPTAVANSTVSKSEIHQNVTGCSNRTAMFTFNPKSIIEKELEESGLNSTFFSEIDWPDALDTGLKALRITTKAMFVLYCIAIGFIGIALISAVVGIFFEGRISALFNIIIDWLGFVTIGIASAVATAIAVKATDIINKYGDDIGVSAKRGNKFLIITWVATGLMLLASIVWCFACVKGRKHRGPSGKPSGRKHG